MIDDASRVWMLKNGSAKAGAHLLDPQRLFPFQPIAFPSRAANQTHVFNINQSDVTTWMVNKAPFIEPKVPIIYGNVSGGWNSNTTYHMPSNSVIDMILKIANESMDTVCDRFNVRVRSLIARVQMGHPMHLHGHKFWVLGTGTGPFPYVTVADAPASLLNFENPPYRDTVELPASGWAVLR